MIQSDVALLQKPEKWPNWPYMPVVSLDYPDGPVGVIIADGKPTVIVGVNLFRLGERPGGTSGEKLKPFERKNYDSFEKLLEEWRID